MPQKKEWTPSPWIKLRPTFLADYFKHYRPLVDRVHKVYLPDLKAVLAFAALYVKTNDRDP